MSLAYLFDIDGTLANGAHRVHHITTDNPKDWRAFFAKVGGDRPIPHMLTMAYDLWSGACSGRSGAQILYVSGRSDECREATEKWLVEHGAPPGKVYMRKSGDYRDDTVIKIELLAQILADGYEPIMAFDDRNRVVKAWRAAGVPCAQVAEGDF